MLWLFSLRLGASTLAQTVADSAIAMINTDIPIYHQQPPFQIVPSEILEILPKFHQALAFITPKNSWKVWDIHAKIGN